MPATKPRSFRRPRRKRYGRSATSGPLIHHACGHSQHHALKGPAWKKKRDIESKAKLVCTACWQKEKAEEMEALCGIEDLPPLVGTIPQVLWARSIRGLYLFRMLGDLKALDRACAERSLKPLDPKLHQAFMKRLHRQTKAKWWIDHRDVERPLEGLLTPKQRAKVLALEQEIESTALVEVPF